VVCSPSGQPSQDANHAGPISITTVTKASPATDQGLRGIPLPRLSFCVEPFPRTLRTVRTGNHPGGCKATAYASTSISWTPMGSRLGM
jgi:hypothetical protein